MEGWYEFSLAEWNSFVLADWSEFVLTYAGNGKYFIEACHTHVPATWGASFSGVEQADARIGRVESISGVI